MRKVCTVTKYYFTTPELSTVVINILIILIKVRIIYSYFTFYLYFPHYATNTQAKKIYYLIHYKKNTLLQTTNMAQLTTVPKDLLHIFVRNISALRGL